MVPVLRFSCTSRRDSSSATEASPELPPFAREEFEARAEGARELMTHHRLDAIVLTSETQFAWVTPSRPRYLIVPRTADPAAVIPEIGLTN